MQPTRREGLWSLPSAAGIVAGSMAAPQLTRNFAACGADRPPAALLLAAEGLAFADSRWIKFWTGGDRRRLERRFVGLGVGPVGALATDLIVGAAPAREAGTASGISETGTRALRRCARDRDSRQHRDCGVSQPVRDEADRDRCATRQARDTLGGAIAAGSHLPAALSARVLTTSHSAFVQGLHAAALRRRGRRHRGGGSERRIARYRTSASLRSPQDRSSWLRSLRRNRPSSDCSFGL